jgi:hypothetical protein
MLFYITIGNSDDKLRQQEWAQYCQRVDKALRGEGWTRHGYWHSAPDSPWQNAIWCIEADEEPPGLKEKLRTAAGQYRQDSIAWTQAPFTDFLTPRKEAD